MRTERSSLARSSRTASLEKGGARLHGDRRHHLQQMVLDHVAQRAGFLVIGAAAFHADRFGRRDLHVIDIAAVPQRLENSVAEAERHDVLDGFLAQIVVDAVDLFFLKMRLHARVELPRAGEIVAERLFDDDAAPAVALCQPAAPRPSAIPRTGWAGWKDKTERCRRFRAASRFRRATCRSSGRGRRSPTSPAQIEEALGEGSPEIFIERRVFQELRDRIVHARAKIIVGHRGARNSDDGETGREPAFISQPVKRGHQFALCQIAIGAENDHRARRRLAVKAQRIVEGRIG